MPAGTYYSNVTWTLNISSVPEYGDMEIVFSWKDTAGNWLPLHAGDNIATVKVARSLFGAEFSLPDAYQSPLMASSMELRNEKLFAGYENEARVTVRNFNTENIETSVRLVWIPKEQYSENIQLSDYPSTETQSLALLASESVELSFPFNIAEKGDYMMLLYSDECVIDCTPLAVTVGAVAYPSVSDVVFASEEVEAGDDIEVSFTLAAEENYEGYIRLSLMSTVDAASPQQSVRRLVSQDATDSSLFAVSLIAGVPETVTASISVAEDFVPGTTSLQIQFSNPADGTMVDDPNASDYADTADLVVKEQVYTSPVAVAALTYMDNSFKNGMENKVYAIVYAEDGLVGEMMAFCEYDGSQIIIGESVSVNLAKGETAEIELPVTVSTGSKNGTYEMSIKYRTANSDEYQTLSLGEYENMALFTVDALQTNITSLLSDPEVKVGNGGVELSNMPVGGRFVICNERGVLIADCEITDDRMNIHLDKSGIYVLSVIEGMTRRTIKILKK